jgi:hypothetical protein
MATEKVMITISGLQDHEVILASDSQHAKALRQVDLFQVANSPPGAPARPEDQSSSTLAKAPPEVAGAPQTIEAAQPTAEVEKSAPAPTPAAVATKKPWEVASGNPTAVNFRPDQSLHAKMEWVCDNVPKRSKLRILRDGAMAECDRLIALHYKG